MDSIEEAAAIYDILESDGAAPGLRDSFVHWYHEPDQREWRFIGSLGFGGKFIKQSGRLVVSCYPEDRNTERIATIERLNARLAEVVKPKTYEDCEPIEAIALHCEDCDRFYEGQAAMKEHLLSSGGTHRVVWLKEKVDA